MIADPFDGRSMFDYDARPVTRQVQLFGQRTSSAGYALRDFLSRNSCPYEWFDVEDEEQFRGLLGPDNLHASRMPVCILPDGTVVAEATVQKVADGLGMLAGPSQSEYDLAIVGAGPAGLAAAVYATSEGLRTVVFEAVAPGGQAGTTSMIENYLGFPKGVSGSELATRATTQARRFGAEILLARPLVKVTPDGSGHVVHLSDGTTTRAHTLLVATGVEWRHLDVPGLEELLGAGVYYGAGPSEAVSCQGCRVAVVGGGNSAGQAVVRFSRYASHVTLIVRGDGLGSSMSRYLLDRVTSLENVDVRMSTEVVGVEAEGRLRGLVLGTRGGSERQHLALEALFVCIGGEPRTTGAKAAGLATDQAGYFLCGAGLTSAPSALHVWPLSRQPLPLETNFPGVFAAGDIRSGSIKRCSAAIGEGSMAVALVHQRLAEVGEAGA